MTPSEHIKRLEQELADLKAELNRPKTFEFEWKDDNAFYVGAISIKDRFYGANMEALEHGRYRKTEQGAELSLTRNRQANRLEMLVEYLGGLKEFKYNEENWYIFKEVSSNTYRMYINKFTRSIGTVYMDNNTAIKVCHILNNNEFTL